MSKYAFDFEMAQNSKNSILQLGPLSYIRVTPVVQGPVPSRVKLTNRAKSPKSKQGSDITKRLLLTFDLILFMRKKIDDTSRYLGSN